MQASCALLACLLCALLPAPTAFLLAPGAGCAQVGGVPSAVSRRPPAPLRAARNAPSMSAGGAQSAWEAMVDRVVEDLNKGVAKYVFVRGLDPETAAELRAAVVVAGRGYRRRNVPAEGAPAPSLDEVVKAVHGLVKGAIVDREGLVSEEEWDKIARGFGQASAIVNEAGEERPAEAPPLTLDEVVVQLQRLFPNALPTEVEEAARRGQALKAATDLIMTAAVPLARVSPGAASVRLPAAPRNAEAVPPLGEGCLLTKPVNGGASAFGLFFDICAKEHPIRVTELRVASSAGLNFGEGKPVAVVVSVCTSGTARGKEMDAAAWSRVYSEDGVNLPMASWFDERPNYAVLRLLDGVEVAPGQAVGVCIHTSDVNGLAIRMAQRQAGIDSDMTDDDFGGKQEDDEVGGALRDSYMIGQVTDEDPCLELRCGFTACSPSLDMPPVSPPVPAAFVGAISYTRTA
eukprot:Tamp_15360.p1 GENE.Tamp_15360~~Tamp_15360.p1  ORF type:complete len:460 (-),score=114.09 Tamp_15360:168-1547(-)